MDMDPSRENSDERRQKEEQRMKEVYQQLRRDLQTEASEQTRKWIEEDKRKKEEGERTWEKRIEEEKRKKEQEERKKEAIDRSYEKLQAVVKKYDDGMVAGWKEDIDTLLVFAGLFSAVITAFLVESYRWLSEDDTVLLLAQISLQLNGTQTQPTPFSPEASSIRINCFWFLSLILSLTSALFGLLCKQWLREHQHDVPTRTPGEDLALRQLRRDSFERWGVASFLSALPILLELALVFFFVGVLDLLWTLEAIVFGICLPAISLSMGLYFLTTILPTITMPRDIDQAQFIDIEDETYRYRHNFGQLEYQFICPYKSPQAWAVYKLLTTLPKPLLRFPYINKFIKTHLRPLWDHIETKTSTWSTFDLRVVRQFDREDPLKVVFPEIFTLQVYELQALQWAITVFCDSPSMIPHLENVLKSLPRIVATLVVLDRPDIAMCQVEWNIEGYLRYPNNFPPLLKPNTSDRPLHSREAIEFLFWQRRWDVLVEQSLFIPLLRSLKAFTRKFPKSSRSSQFFVPLRLATTLWSHERLYIQLLSLRLLRYFEEAWKPSPGYDEERHNRERVAFANGFAQYVRRSNPPPLLLKSKRGQVFIRFIHHEIIVRRLYSRHNFRQYDWENAIRNVQKVAKLPDDYFTAFPAHNVNPPPLDQLPQLESIRYSIDTIDTIHPQPNIPQNRDEEGPPSHTPADKLEEIIDIQVHANTTSGVADLGDGTLVPSSSNQGDSGLQALNENNPLLADNDEPATALGAVAEANPSPDDSRVQDTELYRFAHATEDGTQVASLPFEGQGEGASGGHRQEVPDKSPALWSENEAGIAIPNPDHPQESAAPLSAGNEPSVLRVVASPDIAPYLPTQASEDAAWNIDSLPDSEGQDERERDKVEDQGFVGTGGSTAPSSSRDRGRRRDLGRGSNKMNDPNHLRMHQFCP